MLAALRTVSGRVLHSRGYINSARRRLRISPAACTTKRKSNREREREEIVYTACMRAQASGERGRPLDSACRNLCVHYENLRALSKFIFRHRYCVSAPRARWIYILIAFECERAALRAAVVPCAMCVRPLFTLPCNFHGSCMCSTGAATAATRAAGLFTSDLYACAWSRASCGFRVSDRFASDLRFGVRA